jgi:CDP-diacylglycerol--serine O-phosphatidyltransferase
VAGAIGGAEYAAAILGITIVLSLLMVSTIRFRSFKDFRLNARTGALVAFLIGSSVVISTQMKPAFVLVWLLGVYVMIGIVESLWQLPARLRGVPVDARSSSASLPPRDSVPPVEPQG